MKKTHFLQTLYLQKPLLLILLIATLSTLPWIGLGDFYTKGEPREAVLAKSMINKGEWVIPSNYADEFAYKPPLTHWFVAGFSLVLNNGEVTPFTSRLPSALAFIALIGVCFMFFARRRPVLEAFVACLIVITSFEIHRAAMTARIDMLLTFFMVAGVIQLYVWHEKKRFYQLASAWLLLSLATLSKGPVGALLPCVLFGVFLLTQRENFFKTTFKCLSIMLSALLILSVWYYAAYKVQGDAFLDKVFAENFGRFLRLESKDLDITYELGVENPWYYYPITLVTGFLPWSILLFVSLFFIKYRKPTGNIKALLTNILNMDKVLLFSLVVIVVSLAFFTVPASKRSVYIMLVYPFIAVFIARFFIYLANVKPKSVRISTIILLAISVILIAVVGLAYFGVINVEDLSHNISKRERTLRDIKIFSDMFVQLGLAGLFAIIVLSFAICNTFHLLRKRNNIKILMAGFGIMLALNLFLDVYLLPGFKNAYSTRPFAEKLMQKYELKDNLYVTNRLREYRNQYGLNFYLNNIFRNIDKENPDQGYFATLKTHEEAIKEEYGDRYEFTLLESSDKYNDNKSEMLFFRIKKK